MPRLQLPNEGELMQLEGILSLDEGQHLAYCVSIVPSDQKIVEIGSYRGRSACFAGMGSLYGQRAKVYAIDAWNLNKGEEGQADLSVFKQNIQKRREISCKIC